MAIPHPLVILKCNALSWVNLTASPRVSEGCFWICDSYPNDCSENVATMPYSSVEGLRGVGMVW